MRSGVWSLAWLRRYQVERRSKASRHACCTLVPNCSRIQCASSRRRAGFRLFFAAPLAGCGDRASDRPPRASVARSPPRACAASVAGSRRDGRTFSSTRKSSPPTPRAAGRRPDRRSGFRLAQRVGELLLGKPRLLHAPLLVVSMSQRSQLTLLLNCYEIPGGRQTRRCAAQERDITSRSTRDPRLLNYFVRAQKQRLRDRDA